MYTQKRMKIVDSLLDLSGIGSGRVKLRWVSAAEGQVFADYVKELSAEIAALGPFDASKYKIELAAVDAVLDSQRTRWLTGMDRQITERGNVYGRKLDQAEYGQLLKTVCESEYQKALVLEVLRSGPQSVREIAKASGLPVYTVSQRLTDVEKAGQAELHGYEGTTPKFVRLAA